MKYKFPIFLLAFLLFAFNLNAQDIYKVTADKLNVRETKDQTSKKIGAVLQNDSLIVTDATDTKYFKVKLKNGEGWVSKEYLAKISTSIPAQQTQASKAVIQPVASKDNSNIIFISMVAVLMIVLLFIIFKFVHNKILMGFSTLIVIVISYFCYLNFLAEKSVSGKFTSDSDTQYLSFNFKSKDSVAIEDIYTDTLFTAHYVIEGDMIKFKQQENTFLLMIRDDKTLIGEGFTKGIFNKN